MAARVAVVGARRPELLGEVGTDEAAGANGVTSAIGAGPEMEAGGGVRRGTGVLFVAPGSPLPSTTGGNSRLWSMIEHIRGSGFRVGLVTIGHGPEATRQLRRRVDDLWCVGEPRVTPWWRRVVRGVKRGIRGGVPARLVRAARGRASFIVRNLNPELCYVARRAAAETRPTAMIAQYAWAARALDGTPPDTLRIVDTIDIQHRRAAIAEAAGGSLADRRCTREEEVGELSRAQVLLAVQRHEKSELERMCPRQRVLLVGHAVSDQQRLYAPLSSRTLLFVGTNYDPNVRGAREFIRTVWPRIRERCAGSRLVICGSVCDAFAERYEGVEFEGIVPSLLPYYERAAIVINPIPYGTGLKIKTVEALSYGKCVVGTPAAVDGLDDADRAPYFVVRTTSHMAGVILELLADPERRRGVEEASYDFAFQRLPPRRVYAELVDVLTGSETDVRGGSIGGREGATPCAGRAPTGRRC